LILVTSCQQVSALKIDGLWKLNAGGQKADLTIKVTPETPGSDSGLITGKAHWFGNDSYTTNVIGFWEDKAMKIVFLKENKVFFDKPRRPGNELVCNIVKDKSVPIENAEICHGRDVAFTGYLFGGPPIGGLTNPLMMAGVEQAFAGGTSGVGATAERNTFGWCATFQVDMCGPQLGKGSTINATSMSNTSETAK
jgi:hypothetical protein